MTRLAIVLFTLTLGLRAQAPAVKPATEPPPAPNPAVPPDAVVARIGGKPVTAAELTQILRANTPEAQKTLLKDGKAFVEQLALMRKLEAMAEKSGLDKVSPAKEALETQRVQMQMQRMQTLAQAQITAANDAIPVTGDEMKKHYDAHPDRYTQARFKLLFIAFRSSTAPQPDPKAKKILTEPEAKEKIEKLLAQIRSGADFVKLVKEHSDDAPTVARDGDFGTAVRRSDQMPDNIKNAIFALKLSEVSEPVRAPTGFYLFRLEELVTQPFEQVQDEIFMEMRRDRFQEWLAKMQKSLDVKIENQEFFRTAPK